MPDQELERWPRFKIVTYSAPTGIPNGWDVELLAKGAPDGFIIEAAKELIVLEDPESGPLVCFGITAPNDYVCLDPRTKHVVDILYGAFRVGDPHPEFVGSPDFVNSGLDQFIASVRAVTERFPYDSWHPDEEPSFDDLEVRWAYEDKRRDEWDNACREMMENLREIDPAAVADLDGFWMTFVADVQMGNYSTKDILRPRDH